MNSKKHNCPHKYFSRGKPYEKVASNQAEMSPQPKISIGKFNTDGYVLWKVFEKMESENKKLEDIYDQLDTDGDNILTKEEIGAGLEQ